MSKTKNGKAAAWAFQLADLFAAGYTLYRGEENWRTVSAGPDGVIQKATFPVVAPGEFPQNAELEVVARLTLARPRPKTARPKSKGEVQA